MNVRTLLIASPYLITMLLLTSLSVNALFLDNAIDSVINIESNSGAVIDFKQKTADYFGKVKITFGKSYLNADKVRIYQNDKNISRIVASSTDNPAFLVLIDQSKSFPVINCQGDKIDCNLIAKTLVITGNATVDYNNNYIRSDVIWYNHQQQTISAKPNETNANSKTNKVHISINDRSLIKSK